MNNTEEQLRQRVKALEQILHQKDDRLRMAYDLSPILADILGLLYYHPRVTTEMLNAANIAKSDARHPVLRLRRRMHKHGITIRSHRTLGYWLEDYDKAKITERITEHKNG